MFLLYGRHNAQRNMTTDYAAAALFGDVMVRWLELCSNPCQHWRLARRFRYYIFICIHTIYYNISRRVVLLVLLDWEQQPHTEILFFSGRQVNYTHELRPPRNNGNAMHHNTAMNIFTRGFQFYVCVEAFWYGF